MATTAVATDDKDPNRQARLAWVAETLRLPVARIRQATGQAGSLRRRTAR